MEIKLKFQNNLNCGLTSILLKKKYKSQYELNYIDCVDAHNFFCRFMFAIYCMYECARISGTVQKLNENESLHWDAIFYLLLSSVHFIKIHTAYCVLSTHAHKHTKMLLAVYVRVCACLSRARKSYVCLCLVQCSLNALNIERTLTWFKKYTYTTKCV